MILQKERAERDVYNVYNGITITEIKEMRQIRIMSKREDKISENTIGIGIICKKSESKS